MRSTSSWIVPKPSPATFTPTGALTQARGAVIANPIPQHGAIPTDRIEAAIAQACAHADADGISGKELTPFLLQWLVDATDGESLKANKELVINNAKVAALIAQHLK